MKFLQRKGELLNIQSSICWSFYEEVIHLLFTNIHYSSIFSPSVSMNPNTSQRLSIPCTPTKNLVINLNTGRPDKLGSMSLINSPRKDPEFQQSDTVSNGYDILLYEELLFRFNTIIIAINQIILLFSQ